MKFLAVDSKVINLIVGVGNTLRNLHCHVDRCLSIVLLFSRYTKKQSSGCLTLAGSLVSDFQLNSVLVRIASIVKNSFNKQSVVFYEVLRISSKKDNIYL